MGLFCQAECLILLSLKKIAVYANFLWCSDTNLEVPNGTHRNPLVY